ncbi:hypothetical protein AAP_03286 [Ascosphaera apis ARSEF 7405]|uniref:Uncharacterized protein n=1 Tax=Ascosphaera apis ARSEF 7405 TaxID=392613 RepID=A0A166NQ00_9EURO|nr:hypothetical protein AAP_03286 [Ascosphaera apis ARSEF 7405]
MERKSKFIEEFRAPPEQAIAILSEFWNDLTVLGRREASLPGPIVNGLLASQEAEEGNPNKRLSYQLPVNGFPAPPLDFSQMSLPERTDLPKRSMFSQILSKTGLRSLSGSSLSRRDSIDSKEKKSKKRNSSPSHPYANTSNNTFTATNSGSLTTPTSSAPGAPPVTPVVPAPPKNQVISGLKRGTSLKRKTQDILGLGHFRDNKRTPVEAPPPVPPLPANETSSSHTESGPNNNSVDEWGRPIANSPPKLQPRSAGHAKIIPDGKIVFYRRRPTLEKPLPSTPPAVSEAEVSADTNADANTDTNVDANANAVATGHVPTIREASHESSESEVVKTPSHEMVVDG